MLQSRYQFFNILFLATLILGMNMVLILASSSPRRKEILEFFKLPFRQFSPPFDESTISFEGNPQKYVETLSRSKALATFDLYPKDLILAADTVVIKDNELFEKPVDQASALEMLLKLQGTSHQVYTSITLMDENHQLTDTEITTMHLKDCSEEELEKYIFSLQCLDKAGAYGIQKAYNVIIDRIEGCFYNTCGLPTNALERALKVFGIHLWDYLKP